jgi:hypothetical protein
MAVVSRECREYGPMSRQAPAPPVAAGRALIGGVA